MGVWGHERVCACAEVSKSTCDVEESMQLSGSMALVHGEEHADRVQELAHGIDGCATKLAYHCPECLVQRRVCVPLIVEMRPCPPEHVNLYLVRQVGQGGLSLHLPRGIVHLQMRQLPQLPLRVHMRQQSEMHASQHQVRPLAYALVR